MKNFIYVFLVVCMGVVFLASCGNRYDEPTKHVSQEGLANMKESQSNEMVKKASKQQKAGTGSIVANMAFGSSLGLGAKAPEAKDLDSVISPVLKNLFGDAKIVAESSKSETRKDGEVVENCIAYVVKKKLFPKDGEALHAALHSAGFGLSPRLGRKPTIWSHGAMMSLFKRTSFRSYSLVIKVDIKKQQIVVESYRLGSKYDRLM